MPLDASNAYNSEDLVFWVGAKVYGLVAVVSEALLMVSVLMYQI